MKKEIIELRKSNQRHFLNDDGTIEVILYNTDIHYLKDGVYEEIDNTLVEKDDRYHIVGNDFYLSFSKKSDNQLLEMNKANHYFKMSLRDADSVSNNELKKDNKIRKKGSISYNNIYNNIDLNYQILPKKIKETIVIKDRNSIKDKFIFDIKTDLELTLENNKIISDEFTILDSFMYDSNKKTNREIYYVLNKVDDGYELILMLDKVWLECKERAYPVYIDPTITTEALNNFQDTYISSKYPNTNYGTDQILKTSIPTSDEICRSLIKFELPSIATGSNVVNAKMYAHECPYDYPAGTYYNSILTVHKITSDWNESTATWNNVNDKYDTKVEDYMYGDGEIDFASYNANWVSFDITNLVKKWYSGTPNYGLMMKIHKEEFHSNSLCHDFLSKDYSGSTAEPKPILIVTYRNKNGLESYLTYQNQVLSSSVVYENNYNGNVTVDFDLGKTVGGKMPASLKLFYNTNDVILGKNYGFGLGMQLNMQQIIKQSDLAQSDVNLYEYTDEDGTVHYFVPKIENDEVVSNVFIDEDGLLLTLTIAGETCQLEDKYGNFKTFTKDDNIYYLTKITDLKSNEIVISYSDSKVVSITDANNQQMTITYEGNIITVNSPVNTCVLTLNNNKLTKIEDNFGTLNINYNSNNVIDKITDINGKKIGLEYYDMIPYRVKKVLEYGTNNSIGRTLEFNYGFEVTQVTDNTGMCNTYTFNEYGNTVCTSNLGIGQNINECYGRKRSYGYSNYNLNKLLAKGEKIKTINNLIWNSGFERDYNIFSGDDSLEIIMTNEFCLDGNRSLMLKGYGNALARIPVTESGSYTFSFYCKTEAEFRIWLESGTKSSEILLVGHSFEFERYEITIDNVEDQSNIDICIYIDESQISNVYLDNIQLEKGKVANSYNYIDNNDFRYNMAGWIYDGNSDNFEVESTPNNTLDFKVIDNRIDEIITYEDGSKAFKMVCDPTVSRSVRRFIDVSGTAGDILYFSFWYKNSGLAQKENWPETRNNTVQFVEWPSNELNSGDGYFVYANLNANSDEWQYYSAVIETMYDYSRFRLLLMSECSANELYVTNFNLIKVDGFLYNTYDENGNVIATCDKSNNESTFKYDKNNQLIQMTNPIGNSLSYEYDNNVVDRILSGISSTGITNSIKYDINENPIITKIENKTKVNLETGNYYIRAKGTNKYLKYDSASKQLILKEDACSHAKWGVTVNGDLLKFESLLKNPVYVDNNDISSLEFSYIKQDNESFILESSGKFLTINNDAVLLSTTIDLSNQQFYFENIESLFLETSAEYSSDGRFLLKTTDTLFNEICYDVNTNNGLIESVTDQIGVVTNYTYNLKNQLTGISKENMSVSYEYNSNNLLSKIIQTNKTFNLNYDEFFKAKSFYINDNKIIENFYADNNGNLLCTEYGNGNIVRYEYDLFNRVSKIIKMDESYNYYYDNFGNLKIVDSNNSHNSFNYDLAQRLIELKGNDDYKVQYNYNNLNNIVSKLVLLGDITNEYIYEYNSEGNPIKITIGDIVINYVYDELQRLVQINSNNYNITYSYLTNGKRTSTLIDTFANGNDNYKFKYDKLGNIKKVYKNGVLIKKNYYDVHSQLIKEENFTGSIIYTYDNFGNILSKVSYDIDNVLITTDIYEYGNTNFKDQLTKYNNILITYDNIGNPLTIGSNKLTWTNGRQLASYSNSGLSVTYKYNDAGIRTEKTVNDVTYKYYLEGKVINYVQIAENVLYFIRGVNNKLIGFKYNNDLYYYVKNAQDDILGIKDVNSDIIATYEYDSFGKILSIKDGNGNEITSSTHIANINPFRYRSYYYDSETGLYYLNSRYYNPVWGRFMNLDGIIVSNEDLLSLNLYSYCSNNFPNCSDISGKSILGAIGLIGGVSFLAGLAGQFVSDVVTSVANRDFELSSWETYAGSALGSMIGSFTFYFTQNPHLAGTISGLVSSSYRELAEHMTKGEEFSGEEIVKETLSNAIMGNTGIKKNGITTGANSYGAIYKSSVTKLKNNSINNISLKTFYKGATSQIVDELPSSVYFGVQDIFDVDSGNTSGSCKYVPNYNDEPLWCPVQWDR